MRDIDLDVEQARVQFRIFLSELRAHPASAPRQVWGKSRVGGGGGGFNLGII